jgi:anthranilate phosphoribosyltransferase
MSLPTHQPQIRDVLRRLIAGEDLGRDEAEGLFDRLMDGELSDTNQAALLVALAAKGESPAEIAGAAAAMRRRLVSVPHRAPNVVDTCGTGGDGAGTFNISTAAALVASAAGARVAKHGNRSVSSRSGSADVLAEAGVVLELGPEELARCLEVVGIAFLFAPNLHPAMRAVMPVRRELGVRTLFNVLGPLSNPARAKRQLLGVYAAHLVEPIGEVLRELGSERAMVVHGSDGLDEITTTGLTRVCELEGGKVRCYDLDPSSLGLPRRRLEELGGGDPAENARRLRAVLAGEPGALLEITALNAAAALFVAGVATTLSEGLERALAVLRNGDASRKLEELVAFTQTAAKESGGAVLESPT